MSPAAKTSTPQLRRRWHIRGQVQGVGFRPFVYRLAQRCSVGGYVLNDKQGVTIEAQGSAAQLKRFSRALDSERPPLASIDHVEVLDVRVLPGSVNTFFEIADSHDPRDDAEPAPARVGVTADSAVCAACLQDISDPKNRRHGYGLTNCTDCGPRFTIIERVPYDRPNTTMRGFALCDACRDEYTTPSDRRYHAQPIACDACGPKVELVDLDGETVTDDPIAAAAMMLEQGRVVAIKGLGGFHLASRADDERVVTRLRQGKRRDGKPFAIMCRSVQAARRFVRLSEKAEAVLCSPAAPIVLAPRRPSASVAASVAPDTDRLGVMLPYTPIHHLLFAALDRGVDAMVMTSANPSDEPLTIDHDEARTRLRGLCDATLWHGRPIHRRVDDSVVLDTGGEPLPIRRARGYVPAAIPLPVGGDVQGLCVGGELKNTFGLVRDGGAILSQHLGDLSYTPNFEHFREAVDDLLGLFDVRPKWVAHDPHPRYMSTVHARVLAGKWGVPLIGVQHHHAHAAAVMAEHGVTQPVLAVVCDGVGYGEDGTSWGGELLLADLDSCRRIAHLKPIDLIGGDAAAVDTRRCGLALLKQVYGEQFARHTSTSELIRDAGERRMLCAMLENRVGCVVSTAAGRYFDGVAALLGLSTHNTYEAQAAMRLERAAGRGEVDDTRGALFRLLPGDPQVIDLSPLLGALVDGRARQRPVEDLAALFHDQLAWAWAVAVRRAAARLGVTAVALSGGVFCNQRLTACLCDRLSGIGLRVLTHSKVPANDGGLALGQAAVAAARFRKAGA